MLQPTMQWKSRGLVEISGPRQAAPASIHPLGKIPTPIVHHSTRSCSTRGLLRLSGASCACSAVSYVVMDLSFLLVFPPAGCLWFCTRIHCPGLQSFPKILGAGDVHIVRHYEIIPNPLGCGSTHAYEFLADGIKFRRTNVNVRLGSKIVSTLFGLPRIVRRRLCLPFFEFLAFFLHAVAVQKGWQR